MAVSNPYIESIRALQKSGSFLVKIVPEHWVAVKGNLIQVTIIWIHSKQYGF